MAQSGFPTDDEARGPRIKEEGEEVDLAAETARAQAEIQYNREHERYDRLRALVTNTPQLHALTDSGNSDYNQELGQLYDNFVDVLEEAEVAEDDQKALEVFRTLEIEKIADELDGKIRSYAAASPAQEAAQIAKVTEAINQAPSTPALPPPAVESPAPPPSPDVVAASALAGTIQEAQSDDPPVGQEPEKTSKKKSYDELVSQIEGKARELTNNVENAGPRVKNIMDAFASERAEIENDSDWVNAQNRLQKYLDQLNALPADLELMAQAKQQEVKTAPRGGRLADFIKQVLGLKPSAEVAQKVEKIADAAEMVEAFGTDQQKQTELGKLTTELTQLEQQLKAPEVDTRVLEALEQEIKVFAQEALSIVKGDPRETEIREEFAELNQKLVDLVGDQNEANRLLNEWWQQAAAEKEAEQQIEAQKIGLLDQLRDLEERWGKIVEADPTRIAMRQIKDYRQARDFINRNLLDKATEAIGKIENLVKTWEDHFKQQIQQIEASRAKNVEEQQKRQEILEKGRVFRAKIASVIEAAAQVKDRNGKPLIEQKSIKFSTTRGKDTIQVFATRSINGAVLLQIHAGISQAIASTQDELTRHKLQLARDTSEEISQLFGYLNEPIERVNAMSVVRDRDKDYEVVEVLGGRYEIRPAKVVGKYNGIDIKAEYFDQAQIQQAIDKGNLRIKKLVSVTEFIGENQNGQTRRWYEAVVLIDGLRSAKNREELVTLRFGKKIE